jgi:hypothetical protein
MIWGWRAKKSGVIKQGFSKAGNPTEIVLMMSTEMIFGKIVSVVAMVVKLVIGGYS